MAKRKRLESKNPFTDLLNSLKEGKLGHNQIQIAYRAWIREGKGVPDAIKDILGGSANQSGLLFGMFKTIRAVIGGMELAYRRGYDIGYEKGMKAGKRAKQKIKKKASLSKTKVIKRKRTKRQK